MERKTGISTQTKTIQREFSLPISTMLQRLKSSRITTTTMSTMTTKMKSPNNTKVGLRVLMRTMGRITKKTMRIMIFEH